MLFIYVVTPADKHVFVLHKYFLKGLEIKAEMALGFISDVSAIHSLKFARWHRNKSNVPISWLIRLCLTKLWYGRSPGQFIYNIYKGFLKASRISGFLGVLLYVITIQASKLNRISCIKDCIYWYTDELRSLFAWFGGSSHIHSYTLKHIQCYNTFAIL